MKGLFSLFFGNLVSKGTGLVREVLFAGLFGTTSVAAAYRIAQTGFYAPTHALVLETVSGGLVPLYKKIGTEDETDLQAFVIVSVGGALAVSAVIGLALWLFGGAVVKMIAPKADAPTLLLAARMLAVMAAAVPLYVAGNFLGFMETAHGRFGAISSRPALLNLLAIAAAVGASLLNAPLFLAYGILAGHLFFLAWTVAEAARMGIVRLWLPGGLWRYRRMASRYLRNAGPLVALPFIAQANIVVERIVASHLGTHIIPSLDYARFITDTTLALISVPLGISTMSSHGGMQGEAVIAHVNRISSVMIALLVPAALFVACNAYDIVYLVFARGAFTSSAVADTAAIVTGLGLGLGATATAYFLQMSLNAQLRNAETTLIVALAAAVNIAVSVSTWKALGPLALGLGASAYGLTQYVAGMLRMDLFRRQAGIIFSLLAGACVYAALHVLTPHIAAMPVRLLAQAVLAAAVWGVVFAVSAPMRAVVAPLGRRALQMFAGRDRR